MTGKEYVAVAKATFNEFNRDDVPYMAAALTYYVFFSIFPLVLFAVTIIGLLIDPQFARDFIFGNIAQAAPGAIELVTSTLEEALKNRDSSGWIAIVSLGTLIFSASGAFDALDKAVNRAWGSEQVPNILVAKLTSFVMMVVVALLLILSVIVSTVLRRTQRFTTSFIGDLPFDSFFWQIVNIAASLAVIFLGFALLYRFVPRCPVSFRDIWPAALLAAVI